MEYGNLTLDIKNAKVKCNDNEIQISGKELDLLEQLLLRKAKAIYFRCFTRIKNSTCSNWNKFRSSWWVTILEDEDTSYNNIDFNGYKLYVNGTSIN